MASAQDIKTLEFQRDTEIAKIQQEQELHREQRVDEFVRNRLLSRGAPQPTPFGTKWNPVSTQAERDRIRQEAEYKVRYLDDCYLAQVREEYDSKITAAQIEAQNLSPKYNQQESVQSVQKQHDLAGTANARSVEQNFKDYRQEITERNTPATQATEKEQQHDEPVLERE